MSGTATAGCCDPQIAPTSPCVARCGQRPWRGRACRALRTRGSTAHARAGWDGDRPATPASGTSNARTHFRCRAAAAVYGLSSSRQAPGRNTQGACTVSGALGSRAITSGQNKSAGDHDYPHRASVTGSGAQRSGLSRYAGSSLACSPGSTPGGNLLACPATPAGAAGCAGRSGR